jgi:hypothetical protein
MGSSSEYKIVKVTAWQLIKKNIKSIRINEYTFFKETPPRLETNAFGFNTSGQTVKILTRKHY